MYWFNYVIQNIYVVLIFEQCKLNVFIVQNCSATLMFSKCINTATLMQRIMHLQSQNFDSLFECRRNFENFTDNSKNIRKGTKNRGMFQNYSNIQKIIYFQKKLRYKEKTGRRRNLRRRQSRDPETRDGPSGLPLLSFSIQSSLASMNEEWKCKKTLK